MWKSITETFGEQCVTIHSALPMLMLSAICSTSQEPYVLSQMHDLDEEVVSKISFLSVDPK